MNAKKHWADKPILRQLFWFLLLPQQARQWVDQRTELEKDAANLLFALHDAWPYVHQWCSIDSIKSRISRLMRKHGDFADVWKDFNDEKESSAIDTLRLMGYTYHGGELWKPPLGKAPDLDQLDQKVALVADARYCLDNPDVLHSPAEHRKIIEGLLSQLTEKPHLPGACCKQGVCAQSKATEPAQGERAEVIALLKQGSAISRDRGINLDFAKIADRAAALLSATAPSTAGDARSLQLAMQQWESWKTYALELKERLVKYEGGAPMHLNATETAPIISRDADADHGKRLSVYGNDPAPKPTVPDNMQDWKGMDGTTAWHLIERHADNWADVGKMMDEWLAANQKAQPTPSPYLIAVDEALVSAHIGVADAADDYATAKDKLNKLICWSVQVDRDLSIDGMVNRFLAWRLPDSFSPDCYIYFDAAMARSQGSWPVGTNLLSAEQAKAMFLHAMGAEA